VALILSKDGSVNLYVGVLGGGAPRRLTRHRQDDSSPCWSPDGGTICFVSRASGRPTLHLIGADGANFRRLPLDVANATEPDWSPDGKTIAFTTQRGGTSFEVCTVKASGGAVTPLGPGEDPSWAPNSRTLVYARRSGATRSLSLLDVPTRRTKDLLRFSGSASEPAWAR
jgi:TolB protein